MKDDFKKAVAKADLYAEQAVVVTLGFSDTTIDETITNAKGVVIEESHEDYTAKTMKKEFLEYLDENNIPYALINEQEFSLTIALPREGGDEYTAEKSREIVHRFFKDGRQNALSMEAYRKKKAPMNEIKNKLLSPFSSARREVNRNIAKLNKK